MFQHTAARRRLAIHQDLIQAYQEFQHTAARRRLGLPACPKRRLKAVSTHSRPKAAGILPLSDSGINPCFNTQPPEGGWHTLKMVFAQVVCFNTQPPEGGWSSCRRLSCSVHCFNTQPPEGGWTCLMFCFSAIQPCFNTQPPEGGWLPMIQR